MCERLARNPRVTTWSAAPPDPDGRCVVYWMQRAQRAVDNPALDTAIDLGNELGLPVVVFFGLHARIERANLRHYHFLAQGLADVERGLRARRVGFVLRRYPDHGLFRFVAETRPAIVVGDESPLRQFDAWRQRVAVDLRVPLWTVDADVVVPSKLLLKEQYAARTIRRRIPARLAQYLVAGREPVAKRLWRAPAGLARQRATSAILDGFPIDRSVKPVAAFAGGTTEARRRLRAFVRAKATP